MEESQSPSSTVFSVRIVSIDYYMAPPIPNLDICYSAFQGGKVNEVPVIRIYGSTPAGQKMCLHVHRALPYLYISCADLKLPLDQQNGALKNLISHSLEKALKLKGAGSKRQHVHGCSVVRANRLYGYHKSEELFAKIYLYHPPDVSRAASLLLAGAVLDGSVQPHESHVPFLLQFLVDYNLYGMGHLHVSKLKFRQPVSTVTTRRKACSNTDRDDSESRSPRSAGFQTDLSGDAATFSPIWTSTTIPDSWMWESPSLLDSSHGEALLIKHLSTCELEGDAIVDDILNQHIKIYTSLSQTRPDVKMVQSLVPIWEEEFERTGMHEVTLFGDHEKPLAEDVLRTLSNGLEYHNQLFELFNETEKKSPGLPLEKDVRSAECTTHLTNEGNVVGRMDSGKDGREALKILNVDEDSANNLPNNSSYEDAIVDDTQTYPTIGSSDAKLADKEAMGLLSWLASSQAAEDINLDDELAFSTIIYPLLPATSIDKVLEKANIIFESESQQECQDILDSIEMEFGDLKERASSSDQNDLNHSSSEKIIPQVDGSSDDQNLVLSDSKSLGKYIFNENEILSGSNVVLESRSGIKAKTVLKKSLWGSLPFSSNEKVNDDLNPLDSCCSEIKESAIKSSKLEIGGDTDAYNSKAGKGLVGCSVRDLMRRKRQGCFEICKNDGQTAKHASLEEEQNYRKESEVYEMAFTGDGKESRAIADFKPSVPDENTETLDRDLCRENSAMNTDGKVSPVKLTYFHYSSSDTGLRKPLKRMKFANQDFAPSLGLYVKDSMGEFEGAGAMETAQSEVHIVGPDNDQYVLSQKLDIVDKNSDLVDDVEASCSNAYPFEGEVLGRERSIIKNYHECESIRESTAEKPPANIVSKEITPCSTYFQLKNSGHIKVGQDTNSFAPESSAFPSTKFEADPKELIGMTFYTKPPVLDNKDGMLEGAFPFLNTVPHISLEGKDSEERVSVRRKAEDKFLPFFGGGGCEDVNILRKSSINEERCHRRVVTGVPAQYLNDGSYLYMLTPKISPPSSDEVSTWLLLNDSGFFKEKKSTEATAEPLSPTGASSCQINSQDSLVDNFEKSSAQHVSEYRLLPILDPTKQSNVEINTKFLSFGEKGKEVCHSECNNVNQNGYSDCSPDVSQISGPDGKLKATPLSQIGFRDPASFGMGQQLTLLSIEVQAESRGDLRPDPQFDAINLIVLAFQEDNNSCLDVYVLFRDNTEYIGRNIDGITGCKMLAFPEEKQLFSHFINIICSVDPDILMGWDIQGSSLGFLAERAIYLGIRLLNGISRTPSEVKIASKGPGVTDRETLKDMLPEPMVSGSVEVENSTIEDEWGRTHASGVHVGGRIVLNIWRLMRGEVKLHMYTFEAVVDAVLRQKVPFIPTRLLTRWFSSGPSRARYRCIEYMVERAKLNLEIMNQLDMINRTSELARVFGIDFFSVLSRGSQFRVESMLLRLAHTQNYIAISPSSQQVASQPAMECLPLVMEPESGFYVDPVVVLDFQSLYPSMIIAYNLCFCTCLGNIIPSKANTLGVSSYSPDLDVLRELNLETLVTPNGVMFVPSKVRRGILPRLLEEILSTRIMVKKAMKKLAPSQKVLYRIFNARQLALKLISNVTYGYTAAGFSGRMPCAEIADSIVQCGRRTLENAISYVNSHDKWKAKVIYGDTDSMFVLLKGRTVKEAFEIGQEIAAAVTAANPDPVTLKMEKVYHPCFLLTKKRYVGYSYENPDQVKPLFDAKGIETVRRDTCGAVSKIMEQSLRLFFEQQEVDLVKAYLLRQWARILSGRVSLQDFVFAKEVRLGTYSTSVSSSLPPAAIVATKAMRSDPRAEPRYAERIPYVVVHGEPGSRLVDMVVDPLELLAVDSPYRLNDMYYIKKQIIPALQRVFGLLGAHLSQWLFDMPRLGRESIGKRKISASNSYRTRIDYYYLSKHCVLCGEIVQGSAHVCGECLKNEAAVATTIIGRTSKLEKDIQHLVAICRDCGGGDWVLESGVKCTSLACPIFYERRKVQKELQALSAVATDAGLYPTCMIEWF